MTTFAACLMKEDEIITTLHIVEAVPVLRVPRRTGAHDEVIQYDEWRLVGQKSPSVLIYRMDGDEQPGELFHVKPPPDPDPPHWRIIDRPRLKVQIQFEYRDIWMGVFWRKTKIALHFYICLLPMLPLHITIATEE